MRIKNYERYLSHAFELEISETSGDRTDVREGFLIDKANGKRHSIQRAIPRLVPEGNYADNFGLQWNQFRSTQVDSKNGKRLSADRFWACTRWKPEDLHGKTVLEAGGGAGRFTEILLNAGAHVISFDYSSAVDANLANNDNEKLLIFQGDIYDIPLRKGTIDFVFCYGVLQHTPDAKRAFENILEYLRPSGRFSIDHYIKLTRPSPWSTPKYLWRPLTSKMAPRSLLKVVQFYMPIWLPIDTFIKKLPYVGSRIAGYIPIPCWNYLDAGLSSKERLEWAIMDTFDALAPAYDTPRTLEEIQQWCGLSSLKDVEVFTGGNGIVANGTKR